MSTTSSRKTIKRKLNSVPNAPASVVVPSIVGGSCAPVGLTEDIIAAELIKHGGKMGKVARSLGVSYSNIQHHVNGKKNQRLMDIVETLTEYNLDLAEEKLEDAIQQGKSWAIQFYLKYRGQKRGYVENPTVATPKLPIVFNYINGDVVANKA